MNKIQVFKRGVKNCIKTVPIWWQHITFFYPGSFWFWLTNDMQSQEFFDQFFDVDESQIP